MNLYLQKEEHKSVKFVEYSVTGILIVFITWFQKDHSVLLMIHDVLKILSKEYSQETYLSHWHSQ